MKPSSIRRIMMDDLGKDGELPEEDTWLVNLVTILNKFLVEYNNSAVEDSKNYHVYKTLTFTYASGITLNIASEIGPFGLTLLDIRCSDGTVTTIPAFSWIWAGGNIVITPSGAGLSVGKTYTIKAVVFYE